MVKQPVKGVPISRIDGAKGAVITDSLDAIINDCDEGLKGGGE